MTTWKPSRVFYPHYRGGSQKPTLSADAIARYSSSFADALYQAAAAGDPNDVLANLATVVQSYDASGVYTDELEKRICAVAGITEAVNIEDVYQIWSKAMERFVGVLQKFEVQMTDYDNDSSQDEGGSERARILHNLSCPDPSTAR